jgi:integrase
MSKSAKGTVTIESIKGRLRLYWRVAGKRYWLSLGYPDTARHRAIASLKAAEIERKILFGQFDPNEYKSKPQAKIVQLSSIREIWAKFVEFKRTQVKPSTMRSQYVPWSREVARFPVDDPALAVMARDWLLAHKPLNSAKRILVALNDCFNWAIESGLYSGNPFSGFAKNISISKSSKNLESEIDPFSISERDQLINLFNLNKYYKHYSPLISFLFMTGCRPGEALALQWKHIHRKFHSINFQQVLSDTENGLQVVEGLKTQERREFPCNEALRELLKLIHSKSERVMPNDLVFPSPRSHKWIDWHNFTNRGWKVILTEAGIKYRNPYQSRHTFITLALQHGMDVVDVAKVCGNSPDMIYKRYAGARRSIEVPAF